MITTAAIGVNINPLDGHIVVLYEDADSQRVSVDITDVVENMARYIYNVRATSVRAVPPEMGSIASNRFVN
jgi:hypothetical protein